MHTIRNKKVWIAGHNGLVGSALLRRLQGEPCELLVAGSRDLDLRNQAAVNAWMESNRPDIVLLAAAKVGGILANATYPVDFLYDNMMIEANVLQASKEIGVEKLLLLGSSCIYPKMAEQPIREDSLLTGPLEPTNEWYALAKIAGLKLCAAYRQQYGCDFISAMPTNLYGHRDNFDLNTSHVLPALLRKMHMAKVQGAPEVVIWGSGRPLREFLHVDDMAEACLFLVEHYSDPDTINIGSGQELSIRDLAILIADVVGYEGDFAFDSSKPDGTPRKFLDSGKLNRLGWSAKKDLRAGVADVYDWFKANVA